MDENDETAEAQHVQAMPTFKFFREGKAITSETVRGANEAQLRSKIEKLK